MMFFTKPLLIEFIKKKQKNDIFIKLILLILLSLLTYLNGLNLTIEYTGGILVEVSFKKPIQIEQLYKLFTLEEKKKIKLNYINNTNQKTISIKFPKNYESKDIVGKIYFSCNEQNNNIKIKKIDSIGAEISDTLIKDSILAIIIVLCAITIYIAIRFEKKLAYGILIALLHDLIIILAFFSAFHITFDLATFSSILTILGYSINNAIVIFDRIRENKKKQPLETKLKMVNNSINQTLKRTTLTSLLTLITATILFTLGGYTLYSFSLAFIIGILIGAYSSIYIACLLFIFF